MGGGLLHRTATSANPGYQTPYHRYYGQESDLQTCPFLRPASYHREKSKKDEPRVVLCFYLAPARNHPTCTVRVLVKATKKVAITRDMTWPDLPSASTSNNERYLPDSGGKPVVESIATVKQEVEQSESDQDNDSDGDEDVLDGGKTVGLVTVSMVIPDPQLHLRGDLLNLRDQPWRDREFH